MTGCWPIPSCRRQTSRSGKEPIRSCSLRSQTRPLNPTPARPPSPPRCLTHTPTSRPTSDECHKNTHTHTHSHTRLSCSPGFWKESVAISDGRLDFSSRYAFSSRCVQVQRDSFLRRRPRGYHVTSINELIGYATPAGSGADDAPILKYYMSAFVLFDTPQKPPSDISVLPPHADRGLRIVSSLTAFHPACCAMFILTAQCLIDSLIANILYPIKPYT